MMMLFAAGTGVLLENLIFLGTIAVTAPDWKLSQSVITNLLAQTLLGILTCPFIISFFRYLQKKIDVWFPERSVETSGDKG